MLCTFYINKLFLYKENISINVMRNGRTITQ